MIRKFLNIVRLDGLNLWNRDRLTIIKFLIMLVINEIINMKYNLKPYIVWFFLPYWSVKLIIFHKIRKYFNSKLPENFKIFDYEFQNYNNFTLILKSQIAFNKIDKDELEHKVNATITKMELHNIKKNRVIVSFSRGKIYDYMKLEKGSLERLESVLKLLSKKVIFKTSYENEVERCFEFEINLNPQKMRRELLHIEHKLGLKKGKLTIDQNNGIYTFSIKKDENKMYILDEMIGKVNKNNEMQLPFILGCNYKTGSIVIKDLLDVLHLLVAGKTGSGKSVTFKCIIESLMYFNQNCCFYMLDFAESALTRYSHFANTKYIESDFESVKSAIEEIKDEMFLRMKLFRNNNVENIKEYNKLYSDCKIPYVVFAIDEANGFKEDLTKQEFEQIEKSIKALLKRGRKYGIIILFAVQQTNDNDFCKSWKTQTTRLGHLLTDLVDCSNLTNDKEVQPLLTKLDKGEFYLMQEGKEIEKMKGCFTSKEHNKLYLVLEEVYNVKKFKREDKEEITIKEKQTITERQTN